ncbi:hypothetical protein Syun_014097 [Stephania yunnanensis]|uniref:Uncharacterized protein n=1 Tax=Stephania yunnanensis TaxID=152371 RepID=A0AAP0P8F8_9MAGN
MAEISAPSDLYTVVNSFFHLRYKFGDWGLSSHDVCRRSFHLPLLPLKPSSSVVASFETLTICRHCLLSLLRLLSLPLKPSLSAAATSESLNVCHRYL